MLRTDTLDPLLELFAFERKKDVQRHCRGLLVHKSDLASLCFAGRAGILEPYLYACHFDDHVPNHLHPKPEELEAMGRAKVGKLEGKAKRFVRKIGQTFVERRLFAAHLFYVPSKLHWHLFYFDQRDRAEDRNHWRHGAHIHYVNDMFLHYDLDAMWSRITRGETNFLNGLHVRYIDPRALGGA